MSFLRHLPEFVNGEDFARRAKWMAAKAEFMRSAEVMNHSKRTSEANIATMFAATCSYFSGDLNESKLLFSRTLENSPGPDSEPVRLMADRYVVSTFLVGTSSLSEFQSILYRSKNSKDMWTNLTTGMEPPVGSCPRLVAEAIEAGDISKIPEGVHSTEKVGNVHALLALAEARISALPIANVDGTNISELVDLVTKALKSAEKLAENDKPDLEAVSKFYIGRSLILRGMLFEFNANALMAEAMYRAAGEQTEPRLSPKLHLLGMKARNHLGELLLKWEKREREGQELKAANPVDELVERKISTFIVEPTFDELSRLL
jgi:hypothetical protein